MQAPPFPFVIIVEFICFVFSLLYLAKEKTGLYSYFKWILLLTVIVETVAYLMIVLLHQKTNHWFHNLYIPIDACITCYILHTLNKKYFNTKPLIIIGLSIFFILFFYESIVSNFKAFSSLSKGFVSVFFAVLCCLYYYYLLKQDEYINLAKHPPFWIITGCFFFYFGRTACNFFYNYLVTINQKTGNPIRYFIFIVLNFILYSSWGYAFICKYRQKK